LGSDALPSGELRPSGREAASGNSLYSALAGVKWRSNADQIRDIMRGNRRVREWFGAVPQIVGIVYDHKTQTAFVVDPETGKTIEGATLPGH
jgi:hypothetical protein